MVNKKYGICANCRKQVDITKQDRILCDACVKSLPTAKENSRIKE